MVFYFLFAALLIGTAYFVNSAAEYKTKYRTIGMANRQIFFNHALLFAIFAALFFLSAYRIGTGNDYWVYREGFKDILRGDTKVSYEWGFRMLVIFLQTVFGKDNYLIVFGCMAFLTAYFSMKGLFEASDWFFVSFFMYMANGFYFMSFSNVRYYFVVGIMLYALKFALEKNYVPFVLWILVGALFHKTVILVIPAYFVAYYLKWNKKTYWMIPSAIAILFFGKTWIRRLIFLIYPYYEGDPLYDTNTISYMNILKCAAILVFCLLYFQKTIRDNQKAYLFFNMNLFALILYSFGYYIPEITRICYYLVAGQFFLIPMVLLEIEDRKRRRVWTGLILAAYTAYFILFLYEGSRDGIRILPYLTWVFD